ncbi:mucin-binding protein [Secundilactobacillus folii]|uniref:mucin-binding protein n=1 Tax=Secundilactobacillus folii TaxID=2678357 RepID=UPI0015640C82|nr:KxYKxGKxW signal peptide domain-containing protein [Secundilactobacillus folii]
MRNKVKNMNEVKRYKLYKAKAHWVVATLAAFSFGLAGLTSFNISANAATTTEQTQTASARSTATGSADQTTAKSAENQATPVSNVGTTDGSQQQTTSTNDSATKTSAATNQAVVKPAEKPSVSQSSAGSVSTAKAVTENSTPKSTSVQNVKTTNLGSANQATVEQVKQQAKQNLAQTGQAQKVTAADPSAAASPLITAKDTNGKASLDPTGTSNLDKTVTKDNASQHLTAHTVDGTALTFNGASVNITNGHENTTNYNYTKSTGLLTANDPIDFTQDFGLNTTLNVKWDSTMTDSNYGTKYGFGGDGMAVIFEQLPPAQALKTAQPGDKMGITSDNVDKVAYIVSNNAEGGSPNDSQYPHNTWVIYQAQDGDPSTAVNTTDNAPIETNESSALSDTKTSGSLQYTFNIQYTASNKTLTTQVLDENNQVVKTWTYVVPDDYIGKYFTMAVSGSSAASHAAYSATINSYTYVEPAPELNITSSGLPDGVTGPNQSDVVGDANSVVAFYPAGTTAPTKDSNGNSVSVAVSVPKVGDYALNGPQFVTLKDATNTINLAYVQTASATVSFHDEDGNTDLPASDNQTLTGVVGQSPTSQTITIPTNYVVDTTTSNPNVTVNSDGTVTYTGKITADDTDNVTLNLKHKITQTNKTVPLTVTYQGLPSNLAVANKTAQIPYTENTDAVTGKVTYTYTSTPVVIDSPTVKDYTPSLPKVSLTVPSLNSGVPGDTNVTVTYTQTSASALISYHDTDSNVDLPASDDQGLSGEIGQIPKTNAVAIPQGYVIDTTAINPNINVAKNGAVTYVGKITADNTDDVVINVKHHLTTANKSVNVTVKYTGLPANLTPADKQTSFSYTQNTDDITGKITYTYGPSVSVDSPDVAGYTPEAKTEVITQPDLDANGVPTATTKSVAYTPNSVTANVSIPSNKGNQTVANVTGKTGDDLTVNVPGVQGYTPDKTTVTATVNPDGSITVDGPSAKSGDKGYVTYTADPQSINLNYVDDDNNGTAVGTPTKVSGVTDGSVTWTAAEPTNYQLATNQAATGSVTFKASGNSDITVHLVHKHSSTLPTGFTGKTTRTINYTGAGSKTPTSVTQTLNWTTDTDLVTGTVTYTPAADSGYVEVDTPTVAGYTADQASVPAVTETATTKQPGDSSNVTVTYTANSVIADVTVPSNKGDQTVKGVTGKTGDQVKVNVPAIAGYTADKATVTATVNTDGSITVNTPDAKTGDANYVTYTADPQSINLNYVDDDNNGTAVGTPTKVSGVTDGSVTWTAAEPTNYQLATNQAATGSVTFKASGNSDITVHLVHKHSSTLPTGFTGKTTRTINYTGAGSKTPTSVTQTLNWTTDTDLVTGTVTYTPAADSGYVEVDTPTVAGYTADKTSVPAVTNTVTTTQPSDSNITVTYTPNNVTGNVIIPSNKGNQTVKNVSGKTGDDLTVNVPSVQGYTPDKTTVSATVNPDGTITVDGPSAKSGDKGYVTYNPNTVTGNVTIPSNKGDQVVTGVTGKTGDQVNVNTPGITGYTPDKKTVTATVNPDGTITTTDKVTYTADDQNVVVNFVDEKGQSLGSTTIKGVTDGTIDYSSAFAKEQDLINNGYTPVKGNVNGLAGADSKFDTNDSVDQTYTVELTAVQNVKVTTTITPVDSADNPIPNSSATTVNDFPGTTVNAPTVKGYTPTTPTVTIPAAKDGNVNVTYTPDAQNVVVNFVDEKGQSLGSTTIKGVTNGTIDYSSAFAKEQDLINNGYTPVKGNVNGLAGADSKFDTNDSVDQTYTVQLTAVQNVKVTTTITPVDSAGKPIPNSSATTVNDFPGTTVNAPTVKGYTPTTPTVTIPAVKDGNVNVTYTPNSVTGNVTIPSNKGDQTVAHVTGHTGDDVTVNVPTVQGYTPDKSTVTATVNPDGSITVDGPAAKTGDKGYVTYNPNQVTAAVTIPSNKGDQIVQGVTGKTGDKVDVTVPTIAGYTPDQTTVPATVNPDGTITTTDKVTYTASPQSVNLNYVDDNNKEAVVGNPTKVSGVTDGSTTWKAVAPSGYDFAANQATTGSITFKATGNSDITIHLVEHHDTGTITTTNTVTLTGVPAGAPTTASGITTWNTDTNTATGVTTYTPADNPAVTLPSVEGYTPAQSSVNFDVAATTTKPAGQTATIAYTPNSVTADVTVPSSQGNLTVHNVTGKTGDQVSVKTPDIQGYTPDKSTVTATVNPDGTITVNGPKAKPGDAGYVNYLPNTVTNTVTIPSNKGDQKVAGVTGKTGDTVNVKVPDIAGYTPDKITVPATVNPDGTITTTDKVTYTPNSQTIVVNFIDDHGNVLGTSTLTGVTDGSVDYSPAFTEEQKLIDQGYTPAKGNLNGLAGATQTFGTDQVAYTVQLSKVTAIKKTQVPGDAPHTTTTQNPNGDLGVTPDESGSTHVYTKVQVPTDAPHTTMANNPNGSLGVTPTEDGSTHVYSKVQVPGDAPHTTMANNPNGNLGVTPTEDGSTHVYTKVSSPDGPFVTPNDYYDNTKPTAPVTPTNPTNPKNPQQPQQPNKGNSGSGQQPEGNVIGRLKQHHNNGNDQTMQGGSNTTGMNTGRNGNGASKMSAAGGNQAANVASATVEPTQSAQNRTQNTTDQQGKLPQTSDANERNSTLSGLGILALLGTLVSGAWFRRKKTNK